MSCGAGYTIYMCKYTSQYTLKKMDFIVCKLYFNKSNLKKAGALLKAFNIYFQIALPLT